MLDSFDRALLNVLQNDASLTGEALSELVALSPSAIARRLRRLRAQRWISRTIALLSPRVTQRRSRAVVLIQLHDNVDAMRRSTLAARLLATKEVQFCYEVTGANDLVAMVDCGDMTTLHETVDELLAVGGIVRRYDTNFIKREIKFAPFVDLTGSRTDFGQAGFGGSRAVLALVHDRERHVETQVL